MASIAQIVKTLIENSIDRDYIVECGLDVNNKESLAMVYAAEYGYNGVSPKTCKGYLQGLPSVCTIPFENHEILQILERHGISRKTESGKERLIDMYWEEAGFQFYRMIK